jgi:hypothetical protein
MGTLVQLDDHRPGLAPAPEPEDLGDWDLLAIAALLWVTSVARVVLAFLHREVSETEATLAFLCVILIPWWWFAEQRRRQRGRRGCSTALRGPAR